MAAARARRLAGSGGTAYVYVAPCRGEDLLKLGFSRDPLQRLQALQPRWYDFFALDAGWLIETDHERDARELELQLRRGLAGLNAPSPLLVVRAAAGHTEWFRGARPTLAAASAALHELGYPLHPLRGWLRERMQARSDALFEWAEQTLEAIVAAELAGDPDDGRPATAGLRRSLRDTLDAWPALDLPLTPRVSTAVAEWHALAGADAR